jgi:hypothetical protein
MQRGRVVCRPHTEKPSAEIWRLAKNESAVCITRWYTLVYSRSTPTLTYAVIMCHRNGRRSDNRLFMTFLLQSSCFETFGVFELLKPTKQSWRQGGENKPLYIITNTQHRTVYRTDPL